MVKCELCGKVFEHISPTHLSFKHNTSAKQYLEDFPNAVFQSEEFRNKAYGHNKGENHYLYNKHPSIGTRQKLSLARKGNTNASGKSHRAKITQVQEYGREKALEIKRSQSETQCNNWTDETSIYNSKEYRSKLSLAQKARWSNPETAYEFLRAQNVKPNKEERILHEIIENLGVGFLINVTGSVQKEKLISFNGAIPDFLDCDNHKVILYNGCNWHCCDECNGKHPRGVSKDIVQKHDAEVIQSIESAGWKVLVLWSHDLKERSSLESKVLNF